MRQTAAGDRAGMRFLELLNQAALTGRRLFVPVD